jgi:hypothetical protein
MQDEQVFASMTAEALKFPYLIEAHTVRCPQCNTVLGEYLFGGEVHLPTLQVGRADHPHRADDDEELGDDPDRGLPARPTRPAVLTAPRCPRGLRELR